MIHSISLFCLTQLHIFYLDDTSNENVQNKMDQNISKLLQNEKHFDAAASRLEGTQDINKKPNNTAKLNVISANKKNELSENTVDESKGVTRVSPSKKREESVDESFTSANFDGRGRERRFLKVDSKSRGRRDNEDVESLASSCESVISADSIEGKKKHQCFDFAE